ncbi:DUF4293 family protein [Flavobacteriaceae bacterium]|nr:DUF4293 family protein [Flavobacteriaceae bacterium]
MIQRIQSIYLFFYTALAALCFWAFPTLVDVSNALAEVRYISLGLSLSVFITIFLFSKRKIQLRLIQLVLLVHFAFSIFYLFSFGLTNMIEKIHLVSGLFFSLGLLLLVLAYRAIKKDEALVRSLDRLR